jgi:hypothetical protein
METIAEQIAKFIYEQTDIDTPWSFLKPSDREFYIRQYFELNIGQIKLSSGQTLSDLIENAERNFKESLEEI